MLLSLLFAVACAPVTRDNYYERVSEVSCEKSEECQPDEFAASFDDVDQCVDFTLTFLNALGGEDCYDTCDFDSGNAQKCVDSYRSMSCEEVEAGDYAPDSACDEVYDCEDMAAMQECLAQYGDR